MMRVGTLDSFGRFRDFDQPSYWAPPNDEVHDDKVYDDNDDEDTLDLDDDDIFLGRLGDQQSGHWAVGHPLPKWKLFKYL